jgi:hypothetical protein
MGWSEMEKQESIFKNTFLMFSVNKKSIENYNSLTDKDKIDFLNNLKKRECYECTLSTEERDLCNLCANLCELNQDSIDNEVGLLIQSRLNGFLYN